MWQLAPAKHYTPEKIFKKGIGSFMTNLSSKIIDIRVYEDWHSD